jgi:hypothetical protein
MAYALGTIVHINRWRKTETEKLNTVQVHTTGEWEAIFMVMPNPLH